MSATRARGTTLRPARRLVYLVPAAALVYLLAALSQSDILYLALAMLGGASVVSLLYAPLAVRGLGGSAQLLRTAPALREGDEVRVELTITNPFPVARGWLQIQADHAQGAWAPLGGDGSLFVPWIPAGRAVRVGWTVVAPRRGIYHVPHLRVGTAAPFGFFRAETALAVPTEQVLVLPRTWALPALRLAYRAEEGPAGAQVQGRGGDVFGARPYRSGDSLRHIHARASARWGSLVVREYERAARPTVTVLLDVAAGTPEPGRDGGAEAALFEVGVRLVASVARHAAEQGAALAIHDTGLAGLAPADDHSGERIDRYLACVEQEARTRAIDAVIGSLQPSACLLIIMFRPVVAALPALASLRRQGTAITVALGSTDPQGEAARFGTSLLGAGLSLVRFGPDSRTVDVRLC